MTRAVRRIGALTPDQLADLCREQGARVELDGTTYKVWPTDKTLRPVFFSSVKLGNGASLDNRIRDLRKSGIDIHAQPVAPAAEPTQEDESMTAARRADISPIITQREAGELREMVRAASDTTVEMLATAERELRAVKDETASTIRSLRAELAEVRAEVRDLRAGGPVVAPKEPTKTEIVREAVLAYFLAHPGMKLTPQLIELNIGDDLPEGRGPTMVAGVCKTLATAGKISGGASRDRANRERGIYWYDPPAES